MDGITQETCAECGFDAARWKERDAGSLLARVGWWWREATAGVPAETLNARPAPGVWSVLEYGLHTSLVTAMLRYGTAAILQDDGVRLPDPPPYTDAGAGDQALVLERANVLDDIEREASALAALPLEAPASAWTHTGSVGDDTLQARALLFHAVHDASHHMLDVSRGLAALGAGATPHTGTVLQVNASAGGVPKTAVPGGRVGHDGLAGDRQKVRRHHGRPFQALCLWSSEVIEALAADGHPIAPGSAGENITVSGLDWRSLRPGTRLRIGSVIAEVSLPAVPCKQQTAWFSDGDFNRIHHERNPHLTRWYAWVREPGEVRPGDPCEVGYR